MALAKYACSALAVITLLILGMSNSYAEQKWYLLRHFEKELGDNPKLTEQGHSRARALATYFRYIPLSGVYSTDYRRTQQTAADTATLHKQAVVTYAPSEPEQFIDEISVLSHVLVVGHSNTIPDLVRALGGEAKDLTEGDYGRLFIVTRDGDSVMTQSVIIPF